MNDQLITLAKFIARIYLPKKTKVISSKDIVKELNARMEEFDIKYNTKIKKINDTKLRMLINYIRENELVKDAEIISSSNGYYLSKYKEDILGQIESMEGRINAMENAIRGMRSRINYYVSKPKEPTKVEYNKKAIEGDLFDAL